MIIGILASISIPRYRHTRQRAHRATIQSDLRNLAVAQDGYFFINGTYAPNLLALNVDPSPGVVLSVVTATGTGWAATAQHGGIGAERCALYGGDAAAPSPASAEGVIACEGAAP